MGFHIGLGLGMGLHGARTAWGWVPGLDAWTIGAGDGTGGCMGLELMVHGTGTGA